LNIVVVVTESFLHRPLDVHSTVYPVHERLVYRHSGAGITSSTTRSRGVDASFSWGRIVRTTFDPSDLFGLSLLLYYPATFVGLIDLTRFPEFSASWIDRALLQLLGGSLDVVAADFRTGDARGAVIVSQAVARRFLFCTDIKWSEVSVMSVLALVSLPLARTHRDSRQCHNWLSDLPRGTECTTLPTKSYYN
jgi:hypothetical protein